MFLLLAFNISIFFIFSLIKEFFAISSILFFYKFCKFGFKASKYLASFITSTLVIIELLIFNIILFSIDEAELVKKKIRKIRYEIILICIYSVVVDC